MTNWYSSQMLRDVPLSPNFPMRLLAEYSKGKSGSDLKELCRNAAMLPVRELVRKAHGDVAQLARGQGVCSFFFTRLIHLFLHVPPQAFDLRPLTFEDFFEPDDISTPVNVRLSQSIEPLD
jgi:ATPase family AAA domain-containing protein 1